MQLLQHSVFAACKKDRKPVSQVVTVSYPTIVATGSQFYSIPVGGTVPALSATSYDSVIGEAYTPVVDASTIDNTTPGLYVVNVTAKNKYGYSSSYPIYVAVTNVPASEDLTGTYQRVSNGAEVHVMKLATGLYSTDDVGGAPTLPVTAYFAQLNDSTIQVPSQPTDAGTLYCDNASLTLSPGDTSFTYVVHNAYFGTSQRTFVKE